METTAELVKQYYEAVEAYDKAAAGDSGDAEHDAAIAMRSAGIALAVELGRQDLEAADLNDAFLRYESSDLDAEEKNFEDFLADPDEESEEYEEEDDENEDYEDDVDEDEE